MWSGTLFGTAASRAIPFSAARNENVRTVWATTSRRPNGIGSSASLPASIFEKSRMSLMMVKSDSAEDLTIVR